MHMIEKVARAIDPAAWAEPTTASLTPLWKEPRKRQSQETARAAIAAMREPTPQMVIAGVEAFGLGGPLEPVYEAMIDAALEPDPGE